MAGKSPERKGGFLRTEPLRRAGAAEGFLERAWEGGGWGEGHGDRPQRCPETETPQGEKKQRGRVIGIDRLPETQKEEQGCQRETEAEAQMKGWGGKGKERGKKDKETTWREGGRWTGEALCSHRAKMPPLGASDSHWGLCP